MFAVIENDYDEAYDKYNLARFFRHLYPLSYPLLLQSKLKSNH